METVEAVLPLTDLVFICFYKVHSESCSNLSKDKVHLLFLTFTHVATLWHVSYIMLMLHAIFSGQTYYDIHYILAQKVTLCTSNFLYQLKL
jgi:hypothetical protein